MTSEQGGSASIEERLGALEDRAAITDVVIRFAYGLDRADWDLYGSTLADEVYVDFQQATGFEPRVWSREEWAAGAAMLEGFDARQHLSTNHWITLDGDRATCRAYMFAQHYIAGIDAGTELVMHGWYDYSLERRPAGWQITRMTMHMDWAGGNDAIFAIAQQRFAERG